MFNIIKNNTTRGTALDITLIILSIIAILIFAISNNNKSNVAQNINRNNTLIYPIGENHSIQRQEISTQNNNYNSTTDDTSYDTNNSIRIAENNANSRWKGLVKIGLGNARSSTNPDKEYITLQVSRQNAFPITISGWSLMNDKSNKIIQVINFDASNRGVSDIVTIPQGTILVSTSRINFKKPIVLKPGDKAYVITGKSPDAYPVILNTSFKENECTGYFEQINNFYPSLQYKCPYPKTEAIGLLLDESCIDFIDRLGACRDPFLNNKNRIDLETKLSNQCRAFISNTFNYEKCSMFHRNDKDFFSNIWRIYLGISDRELWANKRDTITLFDQEGKIVDSYSY